MMFKMNTALRPLPTTTFGTSFTSSPLCCVYARIPPAVFILFARAILCFGLIFSLLVQVVFCLPVFLVLHSCVLRYVFREIRDLELVILLARYCYIKNCWI